MFWVALATAIMMLSGEGDDTRAIAALLARLRQAITQTAPATPRRDQALRAVSAFEQAFATHRRDLLAFGECLEAADRRYRATQADYTACEQRLEAERIVLRGSLSQVQRDYEAALEPAERAKIVQAVTAVPEAWVLDPTLVAEAGKAHAPRGRPRGLEGVVAERHLTLPRNVVSLVFGPLGAATFGQRYPSKIIDGGTSYAHQNWSGSDAFSGGSENLWFTRFGVRFGLFDDFEAGALFVPLELAPKFRFDSVLVFLTQQFRLRELDLALRLSFQTPSDTGWALAPGALLKTHGRRFSLQTGAFVPMEVGTFRDPSAPLVGLNVPVRASWNVVPAVFLSAETGVANDNLARPDGLTVPLGFGAGYAWLAGSRLVDFTASFTWDHWLLPSRPNGAAVLQLEVFRVALGASVSFQAL